MSKGRNFGSRETLGITKEQICSIGTESNLKFQHEIKMCKIENQLNRIN